MVVLKFEGSNNYMLCHKKVHRPGKIIWDEFPGTFIIKCILENKCQVYANILIHKIMCMVMSQTLGNLGIQSMIYTIMWLDFWKPNKRVITYIYFTGIELQLKLNNIVYMLGISSIIGIIAEIYFVGQWLKARDSKYFSCV